MIMKKKRVVVIGAGFAGYNAVKVLEKISSLSVTLIDRVNHNVFQPMLYQVASGLIPLVNVAVPIRYLIKQKTRFINEKVIAIDFEKKQVICQHVTSSYDYLIICAGSKYHYFSPSWQQHTLCLKTASDALKMKDHVLSKFEKAEIETDPIKKKQLLTFVIVGGGATGVEICGSLTDLVLSKFINHFSNISQQDVHIILIEAGERLLPAFREKSSVIAHHDLVNKKAQIKLNEKVKHLSSNTVETDCSTYQCETIIWCVSLVSSLNGIVDPMPTDRSGRIRVNQFLTTDQYPEVYCIGDGSCALDDKGDPYPGLASVAKQQGVYAANDIIRRLKSKRRKQFVFKDYGAMAVISNHNAIAEFKRSYFHGRWGWYLWGFVHIYFLVNVKNKLSVFFNWMSYYFFNRPSSLIIIDKSNEKNPSNDDDKK